MSFRRPISHSGTSLMMINTVFFGLQLEAYFSELGLFGHCEYFRLHRALIKHWTENKNHRKLWCGKWKVKGLSLSQTKVKVSVPPFLFSSDNVSLNISFPKPQNCIVQIRKYIWSFFCELLECAVSSLSDFSGFNHIVQEYKSKNPFHGFWHVWVDSFLKP